MVEDLSDDDLRWLPRGGDDYRKLYAAYKAAEENLGSGAPTVILAKTVKGWTLGPEVEGRNATHQIKKLSGEQLRVARSALSQRRDPRRGPRVGRRSQYCPPPESIEYQYMMERRRALDGSLPRRTTRIRRPMELPQTEAFKELMAGSGTQAGPPRWRSPACCATLLRPAHRPADRADHPRRGPYLRHRLAVPGDQHLRVQGQQTTRWTPSSRCPTPRPRRPKPRGGITEAGAMSNFIAAGNNDAHRGTPMVPSTPSIHVRFPAIGHHLVGRRCPGLRFPARSHGGRTHADGEGLQHQTASRRRRAHRSQLSGGTTRRSRTRWKSSARRHQTH